MTYSEPDAARMRAVLKRTRGITEQKMFGGICFLWHDHMLSGIGKPGFMFRVGKEQQAAALKKPGASPLAFNGRRFGGLVWVDVRKCKARELRHLLAMAKAFVATLPPKRARVRRARAQRRR
jgi:hypothetical protein